MNSAEELAGAQDRLASRARAPRRWIRRAGLLAIAVVLLGVMQVPGSAQDNTTTGSTSTTEPSTTTVATPTTSADTTAPDESTTTAPAEGSPTTALSPEEKAKLDAAAVAKAKQVNAANARLDDLSNALGVLNARVRSQSAKVDYADQQVAAAQSKVTESQAAVTQAQADLAQLEGRLQGQAIRNFMGDGSGEAAVLVTGDPNQSIKMQTMLAEVTQSDIDFSATLVAAQEDLEVQQAEAQNAVEAAQVLKADASDQLAILQGDRKAQSNLTSAAESRLDDLLSERSALAALGADVGDDNGAENALVTALQRSSANNPPPTGDVAVPDVVSESEIRLAGNGIRVHQSIVANVQALLVAAEGAGLQLGGGGYRDPAAQIATRRSNCGSSSYAIYQMPASQCRPPTARPGQSMHERGLAIDFTNKGSLIRSHSDAAFVWLNKNAANYGLCNLPAEAWHWSTNCK
jgi:peptidoglycan hydrolase CwlO-like protein